MNEILQIPELKIIEEFQGVFDNYYNAFTQYLYGAFTQDHEYKFSHPTLFELSNEIQYKFCLLPETLQKRLLEIEFEIFLHCNNLIDFYTFREFLVEKNRFEIAATIAERTDAELNLAKYFIKNNAWDKYSTLLERKFDFYRNFSRRKLLTELEQEKLETESENLNRSMCSFEDEYNSEDTKINQLGNSKPIYRDLGKKFKESEEILVSTNNIFNTTLELLKKVFTIGKLFVE